MTSIRKVGNIILTYYVNPHHFYFKYEDDPRGDDILSSVNNKIEIYVSRHVVKRHSNPYSPAIGEIVLCHYISDCVYKWIRVRVDAKLAYEKEKFIVWAIDYGFPLESESRWIRPLLSEELKDVDKGFIFKAGLFEIVPSTVEWNFIQSAEESRKTKKWSSRAVESVEKYIHEANNLTFRCRAYHEDHFFGSLIIQSRTGTKMIAEDFLRNLKEASDSSNFLKELSQLEDPAYWQRQKHDAIYKIYDNNSDQTTSIKDVTDTSSLCTTTDDIFHINEIKFDLPKSRSKKDKADDETDEALIKLTDQLQTSTKLSSRSSHNSSMSRGIPFAAVGEQTSKPVDILPKLIKVNDFPGDEIVRVVPMNKRLEMAQRFIVDNKAIEDKRKFRRDNQFSMIDSTTETKHTNRRYQKAKDDEECFSADHMQHILVHDHRNIPIAPINDIHEANFPQEVHTALENMNINQIFRIQTIGWPRILRGSSMIFVNNARTGKTWTYLPAICSLVIERVQDEQVVDGCGPVSIIVCASAEEVVENHKKIEHLLRYTNDEIKCFKAHGFGDEMKVLCELLNGTEILVTTVPRLYRLMVNKLNLFNKKRIISLVFDNIDLVYEQFSREIWEIHRSLCGATNNVQTIVTSRTWFKLLEKFYLESDRVGVCIGSYIEAAIYARTEMTIELLGQKLKIDKLISYISGINYQLELTIVICNTPKDVEDLLKQLRATSIKIWGYHDRSDSLEIAKLEKLLKNRKFEGFNLLICTDELLRDLNVRCAQHIIHFALPSTWTMFSFRFSVLFDRHENLLERQSDHKPTTSSVVFLDENNNDELPRLIDFMQTRLNSVIPDEVLKLAESKRIENEEKRTNIYKPFCNDLLTIGVCHGRLTCRYRHILTKFDRSREEIPQYGYVKLDIIGIHSPVHFTVRLLEHRLPHEIGWTKLQASDDILHFHQEMSNYFEVEENHFAHFPLTLGDLCVVGVRSDGGNCYERGKIVKIEEKIFMGVLKQIWVEALLIDTNERVSCLSTELRQLPERFKSFPHQAVDVRIAGIRPRDYETKWDSEILAQVKKWIRNDNPHYCQGLIKLSIMNTLWLDSIHVTEILRSIHEEVVAVSVKKNLMKRNFCVPDLKPLELMTILAKTAGLVESHGADVLPTDHKSTQIADQRTTEELQVFNDSRSSSIDLDESDATRLNWTTSTDDDSEMPHAPSAENLKNFAGAKQEDLLRLSKDKWAELTLKQFNKVLLCNFYHPNRVYIRNSHYSSRFMELNKRIGEFTGIPKNRIQLSNVKLAENCLAKICEGFGRAKIMKIFRDIDGTTAEVFFVDLGDSLVLPVDGLLEIPKSLITALPFQAIFCRLIGIRPIDSPKWCDNVCDDVYDNLLVKQSRFYARPMQLASPDKYAYGLKSHSYQVVLFDETGSVNINNWIVSNNYGELHPDTKNFIDVVIDENMLALLNSSSEGSDLDDQLDDEDLIKLLLGDQMPPTSEIKEIDEEEIAPQTVAKTLTGKSPPLDIASSPADVKSEFVELMSSHKNPKIEWHQSAYVVTLSVHAPDVENYSLTVTPRLVNICFMLNQEKYSAALNLFGCVDAERTLHAIRGLNIRIRLVKTLERLSWPRLVQATEKLHWLQYNLESQCFDEEFHSKETQVDVTRHQEDHMEEYSSDGEDEEGSFDGEM